MVVRVHRKKYDPNTHLGELTKQEDVWAEVVAFFLLSLHPGEQNKMNRFLFVSKNCQRAVAGFTKSHPENASSWQLKLWQVTLYFQSGYGPAPASTVEIRIGERHRAGDIYYLEHLSTYLQEIGITVWLPRDAHGDATVPGESEIREISNAIGVANDVPLDVFGQDSTDKVTNFMADMRKLSEEHGKERVTIEYIK